MRQFWLGGRWPRILAVTLTRVAIGAPLTAVQVHLEKPPLSVVTNVVQFQQWVSDQQPTNWPVRLEGTVCWADLKQGMVILQDDSSAALIEMDPQRQTLRAGQEIEIEGYGSEGRGGASLGIGDVFLLDDRNHGMGEKNAYISLKPGKHPISVSWFDGNSQYGLGIFYECTNLPRRSIPDSALFRAVVDPVTGVTNWSNGLNYQLYRGQWSALPNFDQLTPVKSGTATNFNIQLKGSRKYVGLQFDGYLDVSRDALYTFAIKPCGRKQLFIENPRLRILGVSSPPAPRRVTIGQILPEKEPSIWAETEGVVTFVSIGQSTGSRLELTSGTQNADVDVTEDFERYSALLLGSRVRVTGVCRSIYTLGGQRILGKIWVPSPEQIEFVEIAPELWKSQPIVAIKSLLVTNHPSITDLVVHVRGRLHSAGPHQSMVVEDEKGQISVETSQSLPKTTTDLVDVLGVVEKTGSGIVLRKGFYREVEQVAGEDSPLPVLTTAEEVKRLKREDAMRGYSVRIRGVITWSGGTGTVIQDSTMGVFVDDFTLNFRCATARAVLGN